jgi:hypothetical protein
MFAFIVRQEVVMTHTHEFDCRICGAQLDSQDELDQHMRAEHTMQVKPQSGGDASSVGQASGTDVGVSG